MSKVWIMRGLPGSGKSTWVTRNLPEATVFSTDQFFVINGVYTFDATQLARYHNINLRLFAQCILLGNVSHIAVDNTNLAVWEIAPYYRLAEAYGYETEIVQLNTPLEVCLKRNTHKVPEYKLGMMYATLLTERLPAWWKVTLIAHQQTER